MVIGRLLENEGINSMTSPTLDVVVRLLAIAICVERTPSHHRMRSSRVLIRTKKNGSQSTDRRFLFCHFWYVCISGTWFLSALALSWRVKFVPKCRNICLRYTPNPDTNEHVPIPKAQHTHIGNTPCAAAKSGWDNASWA